MSIVLAPLGAARFARLGYTSWLAADPLDVVRTRPRAALKKHVGKITLTVKNEGPRPSYWPRASLISGLSMRVAGPKELRGQDLNLRPSGYEAPEADVQTASGVSKPSESLGALAEDSVRPMQPESSQHTNFGQPVVSDSSMVADDDRPLTPAQAAKRFHIPEYLLRRACVEGTLVYLRVANSLWLAPASVEEFARTWRATKRRDS